MFSDLQALAVCVLGTRAQANLQAAPKQIKSPLTAGRNTRIVKKMAVRCRRFVNGRKAVIDAAA
jgi:hypothetical protein